jgi:outer membrane biosynthesis protein TonB
MRRSSVIISAVFHVIVMIISAFGLPYWAKREFIVPKPVVVDFVDISKVTETNRITPQPVQPEEKKEEDKPPPAATNTAQEATMPSMDKSTPPEKTAAKAEPKPAPDPAAPPEKKKPPKKEEAKAAPKKDFSSVLKNLADPSDKKPAPEAPKQATGTPAPLGPKMTMSEEDALRRQLEKCWNVPFGAKDAENLIVEIFMVINPDRTLREARVVDNMRYNTDTFFRAAADSALRAVRSPLCSPFDVPPDKYSTWNTVTVTFNPKDMF